MEEASAPTMQEVGDDIREFCDILSSFHPGHNPPFLLFQRSANSQLRWGQNGELQSDLADLEFVPTCIVGLFNDNSSVTKDTRDKIQGMIESELIAIETKMGLEYLSIPRRDDYLASLSSEDRIRHSFDIISLVALAFPEDYSCIAWEELREQLREVVEAECLPILRVINVQDLLDYVAKLTTRPDGADIRYLKIVVRFLTYITPSYRYLRFLASDILEYMASVHILPSDQTTKTMELEEVRWSLPHFGQATLGYLKELFLNPQNELDNARAGILVGRMLIKDPKLKSGINFVDLWEPLQPDHASSLEKICSCVLKSLPTSDDLYADVTLECKTIIGLTYSKRKFFRRAKELLEQILDGIQAKYTPSSLEYAIVLAEFVKCCNMTQRQGEGERWARDALANRQLSDPHLYTHPPAVPDRGSAGPKIQHIEDRADTQYLRIALADSLIADSKYDEAIGILHIMLPGELSASLAVKISLRLSKAYRRIGEVFPSPKITQSLSEGLLRLIEVSNQLRAAYIEELRFNLESCEHNDHEIQYNVHEMMQLINCMSHGNNSDNRRCVQVVEELRNNLQQIIASIQPDSNALEFGREKTILSLSTLLTDLPQLRETNQRGELDKDKIQGEKRGLKDFQTNEDYIWVSNMTSSFSGNMMKIAIAGSGGLAQVFAQHLNETVHHFIILSRSDQPTLTAQGYQVTPIDYDSQNNLRYILRGVDLVISTVSGVPQINLIDAAAHAGVRRFVPAEFEGPPARRATNDPLDRGKRATINRLRHWSHHHRYQMHFTIFSCGIFYERFGRGGLAALNIGNSTGIQNEGLYLMNLRSGTAEIVERTTSGQPIYIALTSVHDLGRFMIAALALGLQNWPGEYRMSGERLTVTQILQWAAAVRGMEMFSTDVIKPQDLPAHLQHATYYQDYPKIARIQELIATEQRRYDFAAPNLNPLVNVQPISFWNWLTTQWGVPPAH